MFQFLAPVLPCFRCMFVYYADYIYSTSTILKEYTLHVERRCRDPTL